MTTPTTRLPNRATLIKTAIAVAVFVAAAVTTTRVSTVADEDLDADDPLVAQWEEEIRPAIIADATDLATLLDALDEDEDAANEEYGNAPGSQSAYSFAVTVTGTAGAVDGSMLPLTVDGVGDAVAVSIQVGPAITGTALRDATGLISFNDFINQIEYLNFGTELNELVKADPLGDIDRADLDGRVITVVGAYSASRQGVVAIVPVTLEVEG